MYVSLSTPTSTVPLYEQHVDGVGAYPIQVALRVHNLHMPGDVKLGLGIHAPIGHALAGGVRNTPVCVHARLGELFQLFRLLAPPISLAPPTSLPTLCLAALLAKVQLKKLDG